MRRCMWPPSPCRCTPVLDSSFAHHCCCYDRHPPVTQGAIHEYIEWLDREAVALIESQVGKQTGCYTPPHFLCCYTLSLSVSLSLLTCLVVSTESRRLRGVPGSDRQHDLRPRSHQAAAGAHRGVFQGVQHQVSVTMMMGTRRRMMMIMTMMMMIMIMMTMIMMMMM
jgi:hypothetical protein